MRDGVWVRVEWPCGLVVELERMHGGWVGLVEKGEVSPHAGAVGELMEALGEGSGLVEEVGETLQEAWMEERDRTRREG